MIFAADEVESEVRNRIVSQAQALANKVKIRVSYDYELKQLVALVDLLRRIKNRKEV